MPLQLAVNPSTIPRGKLVQPQKVSEWDRAVFRGIVPANLAAVIQDAEEGDLEDLADLAEFTLRTDPHLRSIYETRVQAVVSSEVRVVPAVSDDSLAADAAEVCLQEVQGFRGFEELGSGLLHAEYLGWAWAQHNWSRRAGLWTSEPKAMPARDFQFDDDWSHMVRDYSTNTDGEWLRLSDIAPARFMVHVPEKFSTPNVTGDIHAVTWPWVFKRWQEIYRQDGMEWAANGFLYTMVPMNAPPTTRAAALAGMENLSSQHRAVFEEGTEPHLMEHSNTPGEAWNAVIQKLDDAMSKALLGSTLNVEVGHTGGNRSLGESQFTTTILPRLKAHSKRLADTIEQQWFKPLLQFNGHMFGNRMPPIPKLEFILVQDEPPLIDELLVSTGTVTKTEMRAARRLPEWTEKQGGNEIAQIPIAAPSQLPMGREGEQRVPLQMALPLTQSSSRRQMATKAPFSSPTTSQKESGST